MRVDQWLWAIRVFKSRARAAGAIKAGSVRVNGQTCKPAHETRAGETIEVSLGNSIRSWTVLGAPASRVSAKLVPSFAMEHREDGAEKRAEESMTAEAREIPAAGVSRISR